jgi:hypothetical protein
MSIFDFTDLNIPTIHLTECEIYILWALGEEGPMSIYELAHKSRYLPEISPVLESPEGWKSKLKEPQTCDYHFVHTKVRELLKRALIQKGQVPKNREQKGKKKGHVHRALEFKEGIGLTFLGLMFYLQNLEKSGRDRNEKTKHALDNYRTLLPFSEQWNSLTKDLGEDKCMRAFSKTVREFVDIRNVKSEVPSTNQVFDGFLKRPLYPPDNAEEDTKSTRERDSKVAGCLKMKEMSLLRDCYIAYLAVNDINESSEENREEPESERELAFFENSKLSSSSVSKGGRIKEFLPKYSGIEYFFTGMFVENLLWKRNDGRTEITS